MSTSSFSNTADDQQPPIDSPAEATEFPLSRILIFVGVFASILLSANWLIAATWNAFWGYDTAPVWQWLGPILSLTFVATTILGRRHSSLALRTIYGISATWLGFLNFAVFAALATWLLSALFALTPFQPDPRMLVSLCFGGAALAGIYGLFNASWLRTTEVTVKLPYLPASWHGRTAALVTDVHLGHLRRTAFTRRIVAQLQRLRPAAVFVSGDLFDGVEADLISLIAPWAKLSTPLGSYYVTGNHEEFSDRSKFIRSLESCGLQVLNNEKVELDGLQLVGIHDGETHDPALYTQLLQRAHLDPHRPSVLLAHQPAHLAIPARAGISLQLSGHTHRGQIWPWHWLAARVHGPYVYGLHPFGEMQVLTSSGAGTWGIPMRVATKCEIVLLRFESAAAV